MVNAKWSILVLTQPTRTAFIYKLMAGLLPQVSSHPGIELIVAGCDYSLPLGVNRQQMRERASGEYICFIDDDDLVAGNYVESILGNLDGVDYVGFRLQMFVDGRQAPPTYNSLAYNTWRHDRFGYYRDISHICPVRRDLALQVAMNGGFGEDRRWAEEMRRLGILKTEHVIDQTLYYYYYRSHKEDDVRSKL